MIVGVEPGSFWFPTFRVSKGQGVKVLNSIGTRGGVSRAPLCRPGVCGLSGQTRRWIRQPRPTGNLRGAEGRLATAPPAGKETVCQRKRPWAVAPSLLRAPSLRFIRPGRPRGRASGTLTSLSNPGIGGTPWGAGWVRLLPPPGHDPTGKCRAQLPARGSFEALNCSSRNSNDLTAPFLPVEMSSQK